MEHLHLSAADYVSKRETAILMEKSRLLEKQNDAFESIIEDVGYTFSRGRKLDAAGLQQLVDKVRKTVMATEPLQFTEKTSPGSRARPGSEVVEMLVLSRCSAQEGFTHLTGMSSRRFLISRKRMVIDSPHPVTEINRHVYERAVQREIVSHWKGGLADVEKAVIDACGLMAVWRHAVRTGRITNRFTACPVGEGLLLGELVSAPPDQASTQRVVIGRDATSYLEIDASPLDSCVDASGAQTILACMYSTAISDDLMRAGQISLRDELSLFMTRYRGALAEIARMSHWPHAQLSPALPMDDLMRAMDRLGGELADIVAHEYHLDGLKGPTKSYLSLRAAKVPEPVAEIGQDDEPEAEMTMGM